MAENRRYETDLRVPESAERDAADRPRATVRSHSGQGRLVSNLVTFVICMALLCGSFWFFGMWTRKPESGNIFVLGLAAYSLTFLIPLWILNSKSAKDSHGGKTVTQE